MELINWLMTEGIDKYIAGILLENTLAIAFLFAVAKIIAKFTPGKGDDEAISALESALSIFKKKNRSS